MIDLDIKYPSALDILPVTTTVSVNVGENINALRDAILNIENVLGLNVNIGLFTPTPATATVSDRMTRIERGMAERNLVFRQINVSDALSVLFNQMNQPYVTLGIGIPMQIAPVNILGPLTIFSPGVQNPLTLIQTPVSIDVTSVSSTASTQSLIKGYSNPSQPLLLIQDTSAATFVANTTSYAMVIQGNVMITGVLTAQYSIDHTKLLNIETVPSSSSRGSTRHVTQGDYHTHRKGTYNTSLGAWVVDSSTNTNDLGIINHSNLEGIGTLPTQGNDFAPLPNTAYHVTGGDLHSHSTGDGAQIDHNSLKNINPQFSNHVSGGNSHAHTSAGDGAQIDHADLSNIGTSGPSDIHVPGGGNHAHSLDANGNPVGDGAQINHTFLSNIGTTGTGAIHVTNGDSHAHTSAGDGAQINHTTLSNIGVNSHAEIDSQLATFRATTTGVASFTISSPFSVVVPHSLGTDQFNVSWTLSGLNGIPPSDVQVVGVIYTINKTSTSFTFGRGVLPSYVNAQVGPALSAALTTNYAGGLLPTTTATPNADLTYTARSPGTAGNSITIEYRLNNSYFTSGQPGAGAFVAVVAVTSPASITVLYTNATAGRPTANDISAAILNSPGASLLVNVYNATGSNGTGAINAPLPPTALSGGANSSGFTGISLDWVATAL